MKFARDCMSLNFGFGNVFDVGTDLRFMQEILGHKSSKTTEI
jgi:hypothetical protein